jgi:type IV secretory pathway TrbD component
MAFATGLLVEGLVLGALSFFIARYGWRRWIMAKRRRDLARMAARRTAAGAAG